MKNKKQKKRLDEMQEKKLLKIEHNTLVLTGVGLLAAIYIQQAVWTSDSRIAVGESVVLLISSLYLLISCIRNGIWDRSAGKPDMKKNTWISLIVSLVFAAFWMVVSYLRYHAWQGSLATFVVMFLMMFVLLMAVFAASTFAYKRRSRTLEALADQDEQEL